MSPSSFVKKHLVQQMQTNVDPDPLPISIGPDECNKIVENLTEEIVKRRVSPGHNQQLMQKTLQGPKAGVHSNAEQPSKNIKSTKKSIAQ